MKELLKPLWRKKQSAKEKLLAMLENKEARFLKQQEAVEDSWINQKLEGIVPQKLQETLNTAFRKAFEMVFAKGNDIIEKTYQKEEYKKNYQVNLYASKIKQDKKSMQAFSKQAHISRARNVVISSVEGIGLGALGIGLPDIPLFTGVLLKGIYEIALSYGFSYEEEREQIFILKLIEVALLHGETLKSENTKLNEWIIGQNQSNIIDKKQQIEKTADALSKALLYMKFIQSIPIVGIVGGVANTIYLKKITAYAHLKYERRFLERQ